MAKIKGFQSALEALRGLDASAQERILAEILRKDPVMAGRLKGSLVTFEDLTRANPQGLLALFQEVGDPHWVMALRGKKPEFVSDLLQVISKRRGDSIREALAAMGPQSAAKVEAAQKDILEKALALQKKGKLIFADGDDPLV